MNKNIIVIGHVDHGKTTFIRAINKMLYGAPKEKEKIVTSTKVSYSIGEDTYTVFDYPGRVDYLEKIGTNDECAAILLISGTDGLMPEASEQVRLCRERGIGKIAVFMNKTDMVEFEDLIEIMQDDIFDFLEENGYSRSCPFAKGSADQAEVYCTAAHKELFFGFLRDIHAWIK